ncbi:hypothetical protein B296_00015594, partial [Ensete ventricosum]
MKIDYACQSSESLRRNWNKMLKVTIQHPFKLKTEVHYSINFLNSVVERINFAEQLRLEREMQRKVFLNDKNSPFCSFYACMSRCVVYLGFFFI